LNDDPDWVTGSLVLRHYNPKGINLRFRLFVKDSSGQFEQWGDIMDECHPCSNVIHKAFGPDVQVVRPGSNYLRQIGIFGLSYEELLQSKWVHSDTLTVKVQLEVRPPVDAIESRVKLNLTVEVPAGSLHENLSSLLDTGKNSDVTFLIEGESIKAHSQILCARSEFFDKELTCGLRESVSKEIEVSDCDINAFKFLLKYLYTDDLMYIADAVKTAATALACDSCVRTPGGDAESGSTDRFACEARISLLQGLLAASHKYQAPRLLCWCEQQLCKQISMSEVCSVLCQAHLYEAKQLEQACLDFIKDNLRTVATTQAFGRLSLEWPEVILKINIYLAGIPESKAMPAFVGQQEARKKRQFQHTDQASTPEEQGGKCPRLE
jgi:speckle-type POZ protein